MTVLKEPVGVEDQAAVFREMDLHCFEGETAQAKGLTCGKVRETHIAVGAHHRRWRVAGTCHGAQLCGGVVYGIQAGRTDKGLAVTVRPVKASHKVVEVSEDLVGGRSSSAKLRAAVRSCPMVAAACSP